MNYETIFYSFLLLFIVGSIILYFGYGKRLSQFRDFLTINRSIGTAPLTIAMISCTISGYMIWFEVSHTAVHGISLSITRALYYSVPALVFAHYIFPRLLTFPNTYTLGESVKHMYGQLSGSITSLLSSMVCCYFTYYHLTTLTIAVPILDQLFSKSRFLFLILVGPATIIQALWISNHRISTTSIIQFVVITGFLCCLASIVLYLPQVRAHGGGFRGLLGALKSTPNIPYDQLMTYHPAWGSILNSIQFPVAFLYPPFIQRVLINQDTHQMKNASWGFTLASILFRFLILTIGLGAALLVIPQEGNTILPFKRVVISLFQDQWLGTLLYSYLVFTFSIGLMSCYLHSLSVELVQNVIKPYRRKKVKNDNDWIKWIIIIVGVFCMLLGLVGKQVYLSLFYPLVIFMTSILAPFIIGCIGLKGNNKVFIIGVITFYLTATGLLLANQYGYFPIKQGLSSYRRFARTIPIAILASGLAVLLVHYLTYYGFVSREVVGKSGLLKLRGKKSKDSFGGMLSNPLMWAKEKMERYDNNPTIIGTFLLFSLALPSLVGGNYKLPFNLGILITIKVVGIALSTIMMFHKFFPYPIKKVFPLLWFLSLSYCIPFCHGFEFLYNPHSLILVAKLAMLLLYMRIITDFRTFLALTFIGLVSAYIIYIQCVPAHPIRLSFEEKWFICELMTLLILISSKFVTYQEQVSKNRMDKNKSLAGGFSHDLRNHFQYTSWMVAHHLNNESILEVLKNNPESLKKGSKTLNNLIHTTEEVNKCLEECLKECQVFHNLVCNDQVDPALIKEINMKEFIENTAIFIPSIFRKKVKIVARKNSKVVSHATILTSSVLNLVKNSFKHGSATKVTIAWSAQEKCLYVQDNGSGIPAEKQPYIFDLYYTTGGTGIGLPFIKNMLEKINASITFTTGPKGTTFFIHLPTEE